jgi:hypothetical protein
MLDSAVFDRDMHGSTASPTAICSSSCGHCHQMKPLIKLITFQYRSADQAECDSSRRPPRSQMRPLCSFVPHSSQQCPKLGPRSFCQVSRLFLLPHVHVQEATDLHLSRGPLRYHEKRLCIRDRESQEKPKNHIYKIFADYARSQIPFFNLQFRPLVLCRRILMRLLMAASFSVRRFC